jgi:TfoX/Sxy family transcriptional regulator of competence genes
MASSNDFIEFIVEQIDNAGVITYRKMFGEYALYAEGKTVAFVCNDQLFVKPTEKGKLFIGDCLESPPFPGAKMWFLIEEKIENRAWLSELIRITTEELPVPTPKRKKKKNPVK